jgi:hypothetical protein
VVAVTLRCLVAQLLRLFALVQGAIREIITVALENRSPRDGRAHVALDTLDFRGRFDVHFRGSSPLSLRSSRYSRLACLENLYLSSTLCLH